MRRPTIKGVEVGDLLDIKRADAETGFVSGYLSKFWVVDTYGETMAPGAFRHSITERGPAGADRILARYEHSVTVGKATHLEEDDRGLVFEARISDDGQMGTALRRHLADGVPYGLSVGFYRKATRPATEDDPLVFDDAPGWIKNLMATEGAGAVTVHTDTKLVEGSAVSFPAVDSAVVAGYRTAELRSLLTDLKAGRVSAEEMAALRELADAWLADGGAGPGESPDPADVTRTASRRHDAEYAWLLAQARQWGVDLSGVMHA